MFRKLLVANRGEIACRIFRTCRNLGVGTIAVYAEADAGARHVREADEAVCIGPSAARQSYLNAAAIVEAALATGADAVHPGYGFLSEKVELVDACAAAGLTFIGPHRDAIVRMGSKIESKRIARAAGIACVPGYDGHDGYGGHDGSDGHDEERGKGGLAGADAQAGQTPARLQAEAERIGFPLLIKASAGGGGKGMRRVDGPGDFAAALDTARAEALAAFGDDRVLLEKLVRRPRHLEVQVWGDRHGGLVHLFERECSIQRHYQKLIEEAPAAHLSDQVRERLYDAAVTLARAIGYDSVGTVEFVLEAGSDEPWFLEMNTRLQVEHPVTELTTGIDLVECQLRSALGEPIRQQQAAIRREGWAIEARINAESPGQAFAPSPGRLLDYVEPTVPGVRIDSGVTTGSEITPHYDSMVAKVIAHAGSREIAVTRLHRALGEVRLIGVATNQSLLRRILVAPDFSNELTTGFLAEQFPRGFSAPIAETREAIAAAAAAAFFRSAPITSDRPLDSLRGFRLGAPARWRVHVVADTGLAAAGGAIEVDAGVGVDVAVDVAVDIAVDVEIVSATTVRCRLIEAMDAPALSPTPTWCFETRPEGVAGERGLHHFRTAADGSLHGWIDGEGGRWQVRTGLDRAAATGVRADTGDAVFAPLPGVVGEWLVTAGTAVGAGQRIGSLEAMKLIHALVAPRDGRVATLAVKAGETVSQGALLLALETGTAT